MEKKNLKLKNNFTQIISQVSKVYKDTLSSENEAFNLGKKEAYEDVLNWFINAQNGDIKYVTAVSFYQMLQEKIAKSKINSNEEEQTIIETKPNIKKNQVNNDNDMIVDSSPVSSNNSDTNSYMIGQPVFGKKKKYK